MKENSDAVRIYMQCQAQVVCVGMGEPVDLNHMPIHEAMRLYRVKDPETCFEKVLTLGRHFLAISQANREAEKEGGLDV
jgi:hypothetical protein